MNIPRGERRERYFQTGVFWDVGDCQIPDDCNPKTPYRLIKSALGGLGCHGDITFWAYKEKNTVPNELISSFRNVGIIFKPDVPGDKHARVKRMLVDILLFVLANRPVVNLLVLSKNFSEEDTLLLSLIHAFKTRKYVTLVGYLDLYHPVLQCPIAQIGEHCLNIDQSLQRIIDTSVARGWPLEPGNGLFWDVMDYPIPTDLGDYSIYLHIGTALCEKGRKGDVSIWAYGEQQTFPEDSDPDSKFKIGFVPDEANNSRGFKMLLDMLFWALDNPVDFDDKYPTLMVLSKTISQEPDLAFVVQALENKYYDVRLSEPDKVPSGTLLSTESSQWLWTSLLGLLVNQSLEGDDNQEKTITAVGGRIYFRGYGESNRAAAGSVQEKTITSVGGRMRFGGYGESSGAAADFDQEKTITSVGGRMRFGGYGESRGAAADFNQEKTITSVGGRMRFGGYGESSKAAADSDSGSAEEALAKRRRV